MRIAAAPLKYRQACLQQVFVHANLAKAQRHKAGRECKEGSEEQCSPISPTRPGELSVAMLHGEILAPAHGMLEPSKFPGEMNGVLQLACTEIPVEVEKRTCREREIVDSQTRSRDDPKMGVRCQRNNRTWLSRTIERGNDERPTCNVGERNLARWRFAE